MAAVRRQGERIMNLITAKEESRILGLGEKKTQLLQQSSAIQRHLSNYKPLKDMR